MVKDAEAHAEEDKKRRELVEVRNQAEQLIHASEKTLNDAGDKAPADGKAAVEAAIADLKTVTTGEDVGQIRAKTETLAQAVMKIGEALYKAQPGEPQGPGAAGQAGPGAQAPGGDKVVDADFEEVDDKKHGSA
jgi:molecular chaperone DnaK